MVGAPGRIFAVLRHAAEGARATARSSLMALKKGEPNWNVLLLRPRPPLDIGGAQGVPWRARECFASPVYRSPRAPSSWSTL